MNRPPATITRRLIAVVVALAATAAAGACRTPDPAPTTPVATTASIPTVAPPAPGGPDPMATDASGRPIGWTACHNTVKRYTISYPPSWHTASVGATDACTLFDPATFTVEDGHPALQTQQLWALYGDEGVYTFMAHLYSPDFFTITAQDDVTIAGRHGTRFTITTLPPRGPSGPTFPVGSTITGVIMEEGGHSLEVATWAPPGDATLTARIHVVDLAATTIAFG